MLLKCPFHLQTNCHKVLTLIQRVSVSKVSFPVTLGNVFSDENKQRLIDSVPPHITPSKVTHGKGKPRKAAVLVPMCLVNNEPSLLFMVRSMNMPSHRGEVW